MSASRTSATGQGLAALAIWASTVAISRSLAESVGALTGAAVALALGGGLSLAVSLLRGTRLRALLACGPRYLVGCGALFVGYMACLYAAIGLAPDRPTALVVGLLNYLWPSLMVAFSVPILGRRARAPALALGCALAIAGTAVAVVGGEGLGGVGARSAAPVALAAAAGVLWALYSNLARLWGPAEGDAVPLFLLASAAALGGLRLSFPEASAWTPQAWAEVAVLAAGPLALAYSLWERGVRSGDHGLLGLASYFVPVASLWIAAAYLEVDPGRSLAVGCALVVAGALVSRWSLAEPEPAAAPPGP